MLRVPKLSGTAAAVQCGYQTRIFSYAGAKLSADNRHCNKQTAALLRQLLLSFTAAHSQVAMLMI